MRGGGNALTIREKLLNEYGALSVFDFMFGQHSPRVETVISKLDTPEIIIPRVARSERPIWVAFFKDKVNISDVGNYHISKDMELRFQKRRSANLKFIKIVSRVWFENLGDLYGGDKFIKKLPAGVDRFVLCKLSVGSKVGKEDGVAPFIGGTMRNYALLPVSDFFAYDIGLANRLLKQVPIGLLDDAYKELKSLDVFVAEETAEINEERMRMDYPDFGVYG